MFFSFKTTQKNLKECLRSEIGNNLSQKEIDEGIQKLGIGESFEEFVRKYSDATAREQFAKSLAKNLKALSRISQLDTHNGTYQPMLSQNIFQSININPRVASSEQLETWLMNPSQYDEQIRGLSQYLNYAVGQYNSLLSIANTSKAFNYVLLPNEYNIKDQLKKEDYLERNPLFCPSK